MLESTTQQSTDPPWKTLCASPLFYAELFGPIAAPQGCKTFIRNARRSRHELKQSQPPLVVESLHGRPEPQDDVVAVVVSWWRREKKKD